MEIFLEVNNSIISGYLSIELTESKLHCNGNIYIEENIEESMLETNGEWEFDMPVSDYGNIVHILQNIEVTSIPEFAIAWMVRRMSLTSATGLTPPYTVGGENLRQVGRT